MKFKPQRTIPGGNGGTLTPWPKGVSGNPAGRPRKIISTLKGVGYNRAEINSTFENILAMTEKELEEIKKDENITYLELGVIKMAEQFKKTGKCDILNYAPTRANKSDDSKEENVNIEITTEDPIEASKTYQEFMRR